MQEKRTGSSQICKLLSFVLWITLLLLSASSVMAEEGIPCTSHNWSSWGVFANGTCDAGGFRMRYCFNCNFEQYEDISNLAHDYVFLETIREPTCIDEGLNTLVCMTCGATTTETVPMIPHVFWEWFTTIEPTCTTEGEHMSICETCDSQAFEALPTILHNYEEWKILTEATCTHAGERIATCSMCGNKKKETIAKKEHSYEADKTAGERIRPTEFSAGREKLICKKCGEEKWDDIFPKGMLQKGDRGDRVKSLQELLNTAGYDCGKADGIFGQKTEDAIKAFSKDHNGPDDGIAWPGIIYLLYSDGESSSALWLKMESMGENQKYKEGDEVQFYVTLFNICEESFEDIEIADPLKGGNEDAILALGETLKNNDKIELSFTYTIVAEDVERGYIENKATAEYLLNQEGYTIDSNTLRITL